MNRPLSERIANLNCWQATVTCEPLVGGITNQNFIVRDGNAKFVARVCEDRCYLGIDRINESRCQTAAHRAGLAPSVVHFEDQILVSPFIDGRTYVDRDVQDSRVLRRLAATLRQLHDSRDQLTGELLFFCPFQTIRTYGDTARRLGASLPSLIEHFVDDASLLRQQITPYHPTLCHNDLLAANIMDDGQRLWIVDWEYAGIGNPLFDLASVSTNCGLSAELEAEFVHAYFGRPNPEATVELEVLKTVSLLREALWAVIQTVMSNIDFDYAEYAAENFAAYKQARSRLT